MAGLIGLGTIEGIDVVVLLFVRLSGRRTLVEVTVFDFALLLSKKNGAASRSRPGCL